MSWNAKIVYPSNPTAPPAPSLSQITGGSEGARTDVVQITFVTPYGESLPSSLSTLDVSSGYLLLAASPTQPASYIPLIGWNVYVGPTGGPYTKQNTSTIAFGTNWIEPTSGLIDTGGRAPTSWGTTLYFTYPELNVTGFDLQWYGHDELSGAGLQQSITQFVDQLMSFEMPVVVLGSDLAAWQAFLANCAMLRVPFDVSFTDGNPGSGTYILVSKRITAKKGRGPGQYSFSLDLRQAQTSVGSVSDMPTATGPVVVSLVSPNPGNFSVTHTLGRTPVAVVPMPTSAGEIWFRTPTGFDATTLYLVASDTGVTALMQLW